MEKLTWGHSMHGIDKSQIVSWRRQKNSHYANYFPGAINTNCPHCSALVSFSFSNWHKALHGFSLARVGCPACSEKVRFMLVDHDPAQQELNEESTLWVNPSPHMKEPLKNLQPMDELDIRLIHAYESTIKVYNSGEWNATAILARRFIDDLFANFLPEDYRNASLDEKFEALTQVRDFSSPLHLLAESVAENGDLGKYLELQVEPDQDAVTKMIDMMNMLIEYLFLLPNRAASFRQEAFPQPAELPEENYDLKEVGPFEIRGSASEIDDEQSRDVADYLETQH